MEDYRRYPGVVARCVSIIANWEIQGLVCESSEGRFVDDEGLGETRCYLLVGVDTVLEELGEVKPVG